MESDRSRKNALAFLDAFAHCTGSTGPRPIDYLAISNMQLLGIKLGGGQEALKGLSPVQRRDQINAFIWLQCATLADVSRGIRRHDRAISRDGLAPEAAFDDLMIEVIEPWISTIPAAALETALDQLARLDEIDAASITAEPPPEARPEPPDPN